MNYEIGGREYSGQTSIRELYEDLKKREELLNIVLGFENKKDIKYMEKKDEIQKN